jgi:hypothetical protein
LCDLAKSGAADWLAHVDRVVDDYLAGFAGDMAAKRIELAEKLALMAPGRERSDHIRERILRSS